jgi:phosphatidyl-myo-inositol alpha-mannosyltransferase
MARGGAVQEIVIAMRAELLTRGHDVKIITPLPKNLVSVDTDGMIFAGTSTDFRSPLGTTTDFSNADKEQIHEMLQREKFDILHFHEPWQPFLSRQLLSYSNSVNIATFHAKIPDSLMARTVIRSVTPYTKPLLKYLHELTAVSEAAAEYAQSMTNRPITLIPNAITLSDFPPTKRPLTHDGKKTILFIGRLERRKGVKYLLKAYARLVQMMDNVELVIAGEGTDRDKLQEMAIELELPNVTFLGYVDDKTKKDLLASSDLFCAPAIYGESFGIVLLEAMSSGLVTVAGDNPGYTGVMKEVGKLSIISPQDSFEFARRMELLLTEPRVRKLWQDWALEYVKQFDYPAIVDHYEQLYKESLKKHKDSVGMYQKQLKPAKVKTK